MWYLIILLKVSTAYLAYPDRMSLSRACSCSLIHGSSHCWSPGDGTGHALFRSSPHHSSRDRSPSLSSRLGGGLFRWLRSSLSLASSRVGSQSPGLSCDRSTLNSPSRHADPEDRQEKQSSADLV